MHLNSKNKYVMIINKMYYKYYIYVKVICSRMVPVCVVFYYIIDTNALICKQYYNVVAVKMELFLGTCHSVE